MARMSPFSSPLLLADGIQVDGACLEGGLLHVDLTRPTMPEIAKTVPGAGGAGGQRVLRLCEWRGWRGCGPAPRVKEEGHE